ncbi:MAG: NGG1p interacting factor NIF3 [Patescibacteria group bacterium]
MTLKQIFDLGLSLGIKNDLRGEPHVRRHLAKAKERYDKLSAEDKKYFDLERLTNPYADSRLLYDNGRPVKKILVGIDGDTQELILAKMLGYDATISHHPEGPALADLSDVLHMQADFMAQYGVPINVAEAITKERVSELSRGLSPYNHYRSTDAARLLDINFMCLHSPCDNLAAVFLDREIKKAKPETVGEIIDVLKTIPEYQEATRRKQGPKIFVGHVDNQAGKITLDITGGTSNSKDIYEKMSQAGVGTIVSMHMSEEHKKEANKHHINVLIAGHMPSDSLGVNLFLDELEKKGVSITPCSGLIRVSRVKKNKK